MARTTVSPSPPFPSGTPHGAWLRQPPRVLAGILFTLFCMTACQPKFPQVTPNRSKRTAQSNIDSHLENVMNFLNHQEESEPSGMRRTILLKLNEWLEKQRHDTAWVADPLFSRLPSRFSEWGSTEQLTKFTFTSDDVYFLQESVWLRDVARAVARHDRPTGLWENGLNNLPQHVSREQAAQVRLAYQLFDWTVRHLQPDDPRPMVVDDKSYEPVAGGKYFPMENLLFGHGDWLEQAHLFILLARQQGIPVVMLGYEDDGESSRIVPWCPAAWIGDELYLFDTQLGIPIPTVDGQGIATLRHVIEHPEALRALDREPDYVYPLRARHLQQLTALMDAVPTALAERMRVLETRLVADNAVVLTTAPTLLWQSMKSHPGLVRQAMFSAPYEVLRYRGTYEVPQFGGTLRQGLIEKNPQAMAVADSILTEHGPFKDLSDLLKGILVMFRGEYEDGVDTRGAKSYLGEARHPDALIDNLGTSEQAQHELQIYGQLYLAQLDPKTGQPMAASDGRPIVIRAPNFDAMVAFFQYVLRQMKQHASFLLGVMELDMQRYASAESWLKLRSIEAYPDGLWRRHAEYNLARTYEEWGSAESKPELLQKAVAWYESEQVGPLAAGCRWRAQQLRKLPPTPPPTPTPTATTTTTTTTSPTNGDQP